MTATIDPSRIGRAARAEYEHARPGYVWEQADERARKHYIDGVSRVLTAAYPELSGDEPSHWLAPMEPTDEMCEAAARWYHDNWNDARRDTTLPCIYADMRDAYLNKDKTDD